MTDQRGGVNMMQKKIFVAGHRGMVGRAIVRLLNKDPSNFVVAAERSDLDLTNQAAVNAFFARQKFDQIYLAAAKVGGIYANNAFPADFIYENLAIQTNVIQAAHQSGVQQLLFLGSSCIYPKLAVQPMHESCLLTGALEPTNEPYAIAKIAGIKLCESFNRQHGRDYRSIMPTNLYGPGDNYHDKTSHVLPALIQRFYDAATKNLPEVVAWGTGAPRREFLYVEDLAEAALFVMNISREKYLENTLPTESHINVGTGLDITIKELAEMVADVVGYTGQIVWDHTKPDGTPQKLLHVAKLKRLGWESTTCLRTGLKKTFADFELQQKLCKKMGN